MELSDDYLGCLDLCKTTPGCRWVTFIDVAQPSCILFKDCAAVDATCERCISGEKRCKNEGERGRSSLMRRNIFACTDYYNVNSQQDILGVD